MLGEVIRQVGGSRFPKDVELTLSYTILYPVETHVHGFGAFLLNFAVHDAVGGGIVDLDGGCRLGMSHFL